MMDDFDCANERDKLPYRSNTDPQRMGETGKGKSGTEQGQISNGGRSNSDEHKDGGDLRQTWDRFPELVGRNGNKNKENQDYVMYADDTSLLVGRDSKNEIAQRLRNYQDVCTTRHLSIQWAKTTYITKIKGEAAKIKGFDKIKIAGNEKALGRTICIKGGNKKAVEHRMKGAKQAWNLLKNKVYRNDKIPTEIRLRIWNAITRSTMTYGLGISELKEGERKIIDNFTSKCMRNINLPNLKRGCDDDKKKKTRVIYSEMNQPTTESWIRVLKTAYYLKLQKRENCWQNNEEYKKTENR